MDLLPRTIRRIAPKPLYTNGRTLDQETTLHIVFEAAAS